MASRSLGTLTLDLVAKTAGFVAGMDKAERANEKWKRKVKKNVEDVSRALKVTLAAGAAGATAALVAVVKASGEQEKAIAQVEARLKSTGSVAGRTSEQLQGLASALQKSTTFGDEVVLNLQSLLLAFTNIRGEVFDRTVPAILDLSTALGQDLTSTVRQVGRALDDPIKGLSALSRTGITFTKEQEKVIKSLAETGQIAEAQAIILEKIEQRYGGSAAAAADTFAGKIEQVKNAFGDLLENPAGLDANTDALQELVDLLQDPETVRAANEITQALIDGFAGSIETIRETANVVKFISDEVKAFFGTIGNFDRIRIEDRIAEIDKKLESGLFRTLATQERINELLKERAGLQERLSRISPLGANFIPDIVAQTQFQPVTPQTFNQGGGAARTAEELKKIEVSVKKIAADSKAFEDYRLYADLVKSLRTEEEIIRDTLDEQLDILDKVALSAERRAEVQERISAAAFSTEAPDFGGLAPEVGGAASELLRIDEAQAQLEDWYSTQLELLEQFRQSHADLNEQWDQRELELREEQAEKLSQIEQARQLASLTAAESLFGDLAGLTKQFAGEQSAAYKVLFAAEKAAAIARSIIAIQTALAQASASGPFPANLAAIASVAAATASIISTISSTAIGQAHDGLMSVPRTGTYLLEQGERVTTAQTSAKLDKTLDDVQSGSNGGVRIVNAFDSDQVVGDYLGSNAGEEVVMNIVRRNSRTIRSLAV